MSNLLLDYLDMELERRGRKFCRYADDCNIYVRSLRSGRRVLESVKKFLERALKLKVNESKRGCSSVEGRQFFSYRLLCDGKLVVAKQSMERVKDKIRAITWRNRGVSLEKVVLELNEKLRGWINYFRLTEWPSDLRRLDTWVHRN